MKLTFFFMKKKYFVNIPLFFFCRIRVLTTKRLSFVCIIIKFSLFDFLVIFFILMKSY
jgi:hypothetical protein